MGFTLSIGTSAPDYKLPGVDGKTYSLQDFKSSRLLIVLFTCNHCPYVVGSEDRLAKLYADYASQSVGLVAINANEDQGHPEDSFEKMKIRANEKGFKWPYLRDDSQAVAKAYGALRTPHFYVFDAARKLRYTGRMDNNPRNPGKETTHELRDALASLLAGKEPPIPLTNPIGCNVKWIGQDHHWMPADACDLV